MKRRPFCHKGSLFFIRAPIAVLAAYTLGLLCVPAPAQGTLYVYDSPITLSWLPASGHVDHYNVYLSIGDQPFRMFKSVATNQCKVSLQEGQSYVVQVEAEDGAGIHGPMSDPSESIVYFANGSENDTDGDGLPNAWEIQYGLDPFRDDSKEDPDGDGLSNLEEYLAGTNPVEPEGNHPPDQPNLSSPENGQTQVSLTPKLRTDRYVDADGDKHALTEWEVSELFGLRVLDISSHSHLTSLKVPDSVLDEGGLYRWRARFQDARNGWSEWSDFSSFRTLTTSSDTNRNGIIDDQEVEDESLDLDGDGVPDIHQRDRKCVETVVGDAVMVVERSTGLTSIKSIRSVDPHSILDTAGKPEGLPLGLIASNLSVKKPGDSAEVIVRFSKAAPSDAKWYTYDSIEGWQEYSDYVSFSSDGNSVTLSLQDGGYGDVDGIENGRIVDSGGYGIGDSGSSGGPSISPNAGAQGGGGGCFIATAAYGSLLEAHVSLLRLFRDQVLLKTDAGVAFVNFYYTYSPPLAAFLAKRSGMRAVTRLLLLPLVGLSRVVLVTGLSGVLALSTLLSCFLIATVLCLKRFSPHIA